MGVCSPQKTRAGGGRGRGEAGENGLTPRDLLDLVVGEGGLGKEMSRMGFPGSDFYFITLKEKRKYTPRI